MLQSETLEKKPAQLLSGRLLVAIVGGFLLRIVIASISQGSNDADTWEKFGHLVAENGLLNAYRLNDSLNHPPLPVLWARLSILAGEKATFAFAMKLPAIVADVFATLLLLRIWQSRADHRHARLAGIAMAFSPVAILVSAYHCNTDSVMAMFSLLAMHFIETHAGFFLVGLAIGAALNVKLIAILLIPIGYSFCRKGADIRKLTLGLALAAIPFLPLLTIPDIFARNLLQYAPPLCEWGVPYFLTEAKTHPPFERGAQFLLNNYIWIGRFAILFSAAGLGVASWTFRRWNAYQLGTLAYAFMLVLAPGFGVQYTVILVPLMLAVSIGKSWRYGACAGLYLLFVYAAFIQPKIWPLYSSFYAPFPMPGPLFGLIAWWILAETSGEIIAQGKPAVVCRPLANV